MKIKTILALSVLLMLSLAVLSFAAEKKSTPATKEFTGESRGADGVGRVFWIRKADGEPDQTFQCDEKSLLVTKEGKKPFSGISSKEFIDLFRINEKVTVKYVDKGEKKLVKMIGPAEAMK